MKSPSNSVILYIIRGNAETKINFPVLDEIIAGNRNSLFKNIILKNKICTCKKSAINAIYEIPLVLSTIVTKLYFMNSINDTLLCGYVFVDYASTYQYYKYFKYNRKCCRENVTLIGKLEKQKCKTIQKYITE